MSFSSPRSSEPIGEESCEQNFIEALLITAGLDQKNPTRDDDLEDKIMSEIQRLMQ